jgi:hypothetical protein
MCPVGGVVYIVSSTGVALTFRLIRKYDMDCRQVREERVPNMFIGIR